MIHKSINDNSLQYARGRREGRRAFSLAELIVSIGILVLMLSLAGQVFNLTVKSTGQATALTGVMQELRAFEQTLREDLRNVQPGNSLILIQGNPVNAYWTREGREADIDPTAAGDGPRTGYPHAVDPEREDANGHLLAPRADILMFFTARRGSSFVEAGTPGLTSNLQQVVYGHAELGEYIASDTAAGGYEFQDGLIAFPSAPLGGAPYPSTTVVSQVPAQDWHLARRSVLLLPTDPPTPAAPLITRLDDERLILSSADVVMNFPYEQRVLAAWLDPASGGPAPPWYLPPVFYNGSNRIAPFERSRLDPTPPPVLASRLGHYLLPNCASFKVEWALNPRSEFVAGRLDGANEVFWFDPGDNGDPADTGSKPDPLRSLQLRIDSLEKGTEKCAPADKACNNLLKSLKNLLEQQTFHGDDAPKYSLSNRFRADDPNLWESLAPDGKRTNLVVFTATRLAPDWNHDGLPDYVPDDMFPGALRITVDVFDKDRRLDRPIRHVMVIPIGG